MVKYAREVQHRPYYMENKGSESLDVLGIKPIGEAVSTATKAVVDGASAFLGRICLPAAEELGLFFRDRVSHWRALQAAKIVEKAERKLRRIPESEDYKAHPRIAGTVVEQGSWADSDEVQEMWAGLLASSCNEAGDDDSNLIFIGLLSQLTKSQAKLLNYACENVDKIRNQFGFAKAKSFIHMTESELVNISTVADLSRLDRELDHLTVLGLIEGGLVSLSLPEKDFIEEERTKKWFTTVFQGVQVRIPLTNPPIVATYRPTDLGLQTYVRCQGSRLGTGEYFEL